MDNGWLSDDARPLAPPQWLEQGEVPKEAWVWRDDVKRVPQGDEDEHPFDRGCGPECRIPPSGGWWLVVPRSEYTLYSASRPSRGARLLEAFAEAGDDRSPDRQHYRLFAFARRYGSAYAPYERQVLAADDGPFWGNSLWRWSMDAGRFAAVWKFWAAIRTLAAPEVSDTSRARRAEARRHLSPPGQPSPSPPAGPWFRAHPGVEPADADLVAQARTRLARAINNELVGVESITSIIAADADLRLVQEPRSLRGLIWVRFAALVVSPGSALAYLDRLCIRCGAVTNARRSTRKYCTGACRKATDRARARQERLSGRV